METEVKLEVDLEKFRYSLVGDGYLLKEAEEMTEERLIFILEMRINDHIEKKVQKKQGMGIA